MNKVPFSITNKKLIIDEHTLDIPHPIEDAFTYHGFIVIRVRPAADAIFNRNIFGVDLDGGILWQIEESPHGTQEDKPYVNVYASQKDGLIAGNWNGVSYSVNSENGKIATISFEK